jgi:hypothetical protein
MTSNFEFHCHSKFSKCSNVEIEDIIKKCEKKGINGIALADHNTIEGALELKSKAPNWLRVVIGEEILTNSGEIIGLFLNKEIKPKLSLAETILEIKRQGGLVILPHPFDRIRSKITSKEIDENIDYFDAIETFNARCFFPSDNKKAENYAKNNEKIGICGSDSHFLGEYGRTIISNINLDSPQEFLKSLKNSTFKTAKISILFYIISKLRKIVKKRKK